MAYYLFNVLPRDAPSGRSAREHATGLLRVGMWGIDAGERHPDALVHGDLVLVYLDAPEREFIGRAELASPVREWTPSEAEVYPGDAPSGVLLTQIEAWDAPVPVDAVLSEIDRSGGARADHDAGVLRITPHEFETAVAVAARYGNPAGGRG